MAFFELRQYRVLPGKRDVWVRFMEEEIIPFQISKGMVVVGSWIGEQEDDLYVWMRRFDSEEQREALYAAVYNSDEWKTYFGPKAGEIIDRSKTIVTRICPTAKSVNR